MSVFRSTQGSAILLIGTLMLLLCSHGLADEASVPVVPITPQTDLTAFTCNKSALSLVTDGGASMLSLKLKANQAFPGFELKPTGGTWDWSAARGVRAQVTNLNDAPISVSLRVENDAPGVKEPFSVGAVAILAGETRMVQTIFGKNYGNPGFALNPKKITGLTFYIGGVAVPAERTLLIKSIETFVTEEIQPPADLGKPPGDGLVLWLDPSKESTATLDADRHVSQLADRSDGHRIARAVANAAQPLLTPVGGKARPMLHFTGKEALTIDAIRPTPGGVTVFVVYSRLTGKQTPGPHPTLISSPDFQIAAPGVKDPWRCISSIALDNAPIGRITIGQDYAGNIDEVLIYDHVFADETDRQMVFEHLNKKWNADPPPLGWVREGPLDPKPPRPHDDLPLTDQANAGKWNLDPKFSDEFTAPAIDLNRYVLSSSFKDWIGRKPGLFVPDNVSVKDGSLRIKLDKATPEQIKAHPGFTYSTGYIRTKELTGYGYYEIEAKPANTEFDCAFWMMDTGDNANQLEIDIFETGTHNAKFPNNDYMTAHVWSDKGHTWATGGMYHTPWNIADDFHVYGLEWTKDDIKWYIDGSLVRKLKNTNWHLPMYLILDAEPMVDWFGPIDDKDFPAEYVAKHLRVWRQATP